MKVVKVQSRWKLHQCGMTVAFRFSSWNRDAIEIEKWLRANRGEGEWLYENRGRLWKTHYGDVDRYGRRVIMIGLRNPEDVSLILLLKDTLSS